jgi:hypothetical protein
MSAMPSKTDSPEFEVLNPPPGALDRLRTVFESEMVSPTDTGSTSAIS